LAEGVTEPVCDICGDNPSARYGAAVIDGYRKTLLSAWGRWSRGRPLTTSLWPVRTAVARGAARNRNVHLWQSRHAPYAQNGRDGRPLL